jgi:hypothetical protein
MTLGVEVAYALPTFRTAAESLMVDTVTITRADGPSTFDDALGTVTEATVEVYDGKARITQDRAVNENDAGAGRTVETIRRELQIPIAAPRVEVDDIVTVTSSAHDPDLVGRVLRVAALHNKTHATARRVAIEEVVT